MRSAFHFKPLAFLADNAHMFKRAHLIALCLVTVLVAGGPPPANAYDLKDNAILHGQKGQLLMEREQYAEAAEEFKAALRLNPYTPLSAALYNNLGLCYRALGDYANAYACFQRAFRIQPTYGLYYKNLIETYSRAGRLSDVMIGLKAVLKDNPMDSEAWFLLGLAFSEQGNKEDAKTCFAQFLKLEPRSGLAPAARNAL